MLDFLRDASKPSLTRQGPVPKKKKEGAADGGDDTVPGAPPESSILKHYSVSRAAPKPLASPNPLPPMPTRESVAAALAEKEAARRAELVPKTKAEAYVDEALKAKSPYVVASPQVLGSGSRAVIDEAMWAQQALEQELAHERTEQLKREEEEAREQMRAHFIQRFRNLEHEEKTSRNNLFVESRAMVLMIQREWRALLEKYKARHPERFLHESGYLKPNRFWLVRNNSTNDQNVTGGSLNTTTATEIPVQLNRPATSSSIILTGGGKARLGAAIANNRRIFFGGEGDASASAFDNDQSTSGGALPYPNLSAAASSSSPQKNAANHISSHNYGPYRPPADAKERQQYRFTASQNRIGPTFEAFSPYTVDREYDLKQYLAAPPPPLSSESEADGSGGTNQNHSADESGAVVAGKEGDVPRRLGEKKVVVLAGDGSIVASTLDTKDLLVVDDPKGNTGATVVSSIATAAATAVPTASFSSPITIGSYSQSSVSLALAKQRLQTKDGGIVVIAPPVGGYDNDDVPIIDHNDPDHNDSDTEDYALSEVELLRREMLFGDKATRAARKQADWELYELKSRELRRKLDAAEAAVAAAEAARLKALDDEEQARLALEAAERARMDDEIAKLTDPLKTQKPALTRRERAELAAMEISSFNDRPGYLTYDSEGSLTNPPMSGSPARALAHLRVPSRRYYTRIANRERREAENFLLEAIEELTYMQIEDHMALRDEEALQRRVLETLALDREVLTKERIRQMEWDRTLGSQQNVIASEEMFLRATYWQEERATRYNLYHWFDDTFEDEVERIRLRMVRDKDEVERKMAHRKTLEDEAADEAYARISKRNQTIANEQNQRVIQLRRHRLDRERLINAEYSDRMFILREEIDCFHSHRYNCFDEAYDPTEPHLTAAERADPHYSIDGLRIGILYPYVLEEMVAEYHTLKASLTKDLSRSAPYSIAKAVGEERDKAFDASEKAASAAVSVHNSRVHSAAAVSGGSNSGNKRYVDRVDADSVGLAPPPPPTAATEEAEAAARKKILAAEEEARAAEEKEHFARAVAIEQFAIVKPHVPFAGKEAAEPTDAERAAAADKANYQHFLSLVDEEKRLLAIRTAAAAAAAVPSSDANEGQNNNGSKAPNTPIIATQEPPVSSPTDDGVNAMPPAISSPPSADENEAPAAATVGDTSAPPVADENPVPPSVAAAAVHEADDAKENDAPEVAEPAVEVSSAPTHPPPPPTEASAVTPAVVPEEPSAAGAAAPSAEEDK